MDSPRIIRVLGIACICLSAGMFVGCDKLKSVLGNSMPANSTKAEAPQPPAGAQGVPAAPVATPAVPVPPASPAADPQSVSLLPQPQTITMAAAPSVRNVAIFVKNSAGSAFDEKVRAIEELVAARISDKGFSVISREDVANAVANLAGQGANVGGTELPGANLDKILSNNTSALRLAQSMGADYVFVTTITTFGQTKRAIKAYGVERVTTTTKLRLSYKILDKFIGGTLAGDVVEVSKQTSEDVNAAETIDVNDLLDEASVKLAAGLQEKVEKGRIREVAGDSRMVSVGFVCGSADMVVPDIVRNEQGEYVVTDNKCRVEAMNVTVILDGVAIGTAPGTFQLAKGLHKLRLTREGYKDYEGTITVLDKQNFRIDMQMSEEGYDRWAKTAAFLQELKTGQKLTDAQVKVLEGQAQMLRQSGQKVDVKIQGDGKGLFQNSIWPLK